MIEIRKVNSAKDLKHFIDFKSILYKGSKYNVPYLFFDEKYTLSKDKNNAFKFCEAEYFMAYKDGKLVGRIAGIINNRANSHWESKIVRFGWLDFVDDKEVSKALIKTVEEWGASKGMTDIVGPLGFTDMDREGMLVEGFEELGNMYTNYNYSYYPQHLESLGFEKDNDYLLYHITMPNPVPEKFERVASVVQERYNMKIRKATRNELLEGGVAHKIFEIVNITYKDLYGYSQLSDEQIREYTRSYISYADPDLISIIVDGNQDDKIVGFGVSIPSFARALQKLPMGRLFPFGWWHMLKVLKWQKTDTVDLLLIGVLPEYRAKGANALIFKDLIERFNAHHFAWAEAMPQMESNKRVQDNWQYMEKRQHKRLRCYKKSIL